MADRGPFITGPARAYVGEGREWRELGTVVDLKITYDPAPLRKSLDEMAGLLLAMMPPVTGWRAWRCWLRGHQPDVLVNWQADLWSCRCRAALETGERRERLRVR